MSSKNSKFKRTRLACYSAYFTMSSVFSLPPLLFITFRETYNISYTLLGTLVLTNFCTQLLVDLIFTFFTKYFNTAKVIKTMPLITSLGLALYALIPTFFPKYAYLGFLVGTVIFSVAAGLSEVLLSPVIAAIPSDNPQRDMSNLHSLYAFGVFSVVTFGTVFLKLFGNENWMYLTLFFAALPVFSAVLFMLSPIPDMDTHAENTKNHSSRRRIIGIGLCAACIFFGSCAENSMTNWISSYMENALHVDKALGDILGMAGFAVLLGFTRVAYGKFGRNIMKFLLVSMICAASCYLTIGLCNNIVISFIACVLTGIFTSMLWPGTLIMMEEQIPNVSVAAFALMAASGDMGASLAPQLLGIVTDKVSASGFAEKLSLTLNLSTEQIGLKAGMLVTALFPILGAVTVFFIMRHFKKGKSAE